MTYAYEYEENEYEERELEIDSKSVPLSTNNVWIERRLDRKIKKSWHLSPFPPSPPPPFRHLCCFIDEGALTLKISSVWRVCVVSWRIGGGARDLTRAPIDVLHASSHLRCLPARGILGPPTRIYEHHFGPVHGHVRGKYDSRGG